MSKEQSLIEEELSQMTFEYFKLKEMFDLQVKLNTELTFRLLELEKKLDEHKI